MTITDHAGNEVTAADVLDDTELASYLTARAERAHVHNTKTHRHKTSRDPWSWEPTEADKEAGRVA